jgi:CRP-like cAMP-binding protein
MNVLSCSLENKWQAFSSISPIVKFFEKIHPLNSEIERLINAETYPVNFKKNKFIISPWDKNENFFLVLKGAARGFLKIDNSELTTWIATEGELIGTIHNFMNDDSSNEFVQAIEDVTLVAIPHRLISYLYEKYPETNLIGRKIMEMYYRSAEERAIIGRLTSVQWKYKRFLSSYPNLCNRISLKYIASFLGVRLETLCRIRSKH